MSFRNAACAGLIACAWVQPAAATTYSRTLSQTVAFSQTFSTTSQYTGNTSNTVILGPSPVINFNQFSSIGSKGQLLTLTGVRITADRDFVGVITLDNGSGNARTGTLEFLITSTLSSGSLFSFSDQVGSNAIAFSIPGRSQGPVGLTNIDTSASNVFDASSFMPYQGNGTIAATHSLTNFLSSAVFTGGGAGSLSGTASGSVTGSFTVEYFYEDPLPEPASWAMLIAGFGLTGAAMRRRRAAADA
jgi:hypothetical protein